MIGIFSSRPILNRQFLEAATSTIQNILRSGHLEYWKFIDNSLGHQTELSSKVDYTILELGAYLMSQIICSPLAYLFACSILLVCLCSSRIQSNLLIVSSICIFLVSLSDGTLMSPLDSYNSRQKCAHFAETCWVVVFLAGIVRKNIHGTLFSEYGLVSKAECFLEGQRDHFLAIIRKNILRAVFPGRGLMARWHNGGGGVLSSSRSGGRGACGRRQPTIMDSPSFHSLSFLVDVFVFIFVFVFVHLCWILFCFLRRRPAY